jgi:hypothetical protein
MADQISRRVELEDRRRRRAALRGRRIGGRVHLAGLQRAGAVDDPDVILRVDRNTDCLTKNPLIG